LKARKAMKGREISRRALYVSEENGSEPTHDGLQRLLALSTFVTTSLFLMFVESLLPLRQAGPPSVVI
jgi:hypothetical protein